MNSGEWNNVSLKYERYASSGFWDLGIMKLAFLAKTQILSTNSANVAFSLKIQENQEHENLHFFERLFQFELHLNKT